MKKKPNVSLTPINRTDQKLIIDWRNSEEIFPYNNQYVLLNLETQLKWFKNMSNDPTRKFFIIRYGKTKVGVCGLINIDYVDKNADVSIIIGRLELHGKGIGTIALNHILEYGFKKLHLHRIGAEIMEFNHASIRLFEKSNFKKDAIFRQKIWRKNKWWNMIYMSIIKNEFKNYLK